MLDQARDTNKKLRMQQAEIRNQRNNNNRGGRGSGRGGYNNSNSKDLFILNDLFIILGRGGYRKNTQNQD